MKAIYSFFSRTRFPSGAAPRPRPALIVCLFLFSGLPVFATGIPVFDASNFMQAVASVIGVYNQVDAAIMQVQNSYEQIQQQINMVKELDIDSLDLSQLGAMVTDFKDPVKSARALIDRNMNLVKEAKNALSQKRVSFGGVSYSMGSLLGLEEGSEGRTILDMPKNISDHIAETGKKAAEEFSKNLSPEQRDVIKRRYDMSPESYASMKMVDEVLDESIRDLFVTGSGAHIDARLREAAANAGVIAKLTESAGESVVSQVQAASKGLEMMITGIGGLQNEVSKLAGFLAQQEIARKAREEAEAEKREQAALREEQVKESLGGIPAGY